MTPTPADIRRVVLDGLELPCRAIVRESRATTADGYSADVEVLDSALEPTGQMLIKVPLDPLWLAVAGAGQWAPPAIGLVVAVVWAGDEAGHPMILGGAPADPAAPRLSVGAGEHSHQGAEWDVRMLPAEWRVSDTAGTEISGTGRRWRFKSPDETLRALWHELCATLLVAQTEVDTDTDPGGSGRNLPFDGGTKGRISALKARIDLLFRA